MLNTFVEILGEKIKKYSESLSDFSKKKTDNLKSYAFDIKVSTNYHTSLNQLCFPCLARTTQNQECCFPVSHRSDVVGGTSPAAGAERKVTLRSQ
jgi:hypothetical protein